MKKLISLKQKGDTIIEVILAMALITLVLFTAWGITNRATQLSLAARKRIVMVNQLKQQAEIIRGWRDSGIEPNIFRDQIDVNGLKLSSVEGNACEIKANRQKPFHAVLLDDGSGFKVEPGVQDTAADGTSEVWVQMKDSPDGKYVDFYLSACWQSGGSVQRDENSQLFMRLNT